MSKSSKEEIDELEQKFEAEINEIYNSSNKYEGMSDSDKSEVMEVAKGFNRLVIDALTSDAFCKETNERLQTQKAESVFDESSLASHIWEFIYNCDKTYYIDFDKDDE